MSYSGLYDFISHLEKKGELQRIKTFVNPVLEITEVTDRVTKAGGKALLFENTGTTFPLLINAFGSDTRMALAIGSNSLKESGLEFEKTIGKITGTSGNLMKKLSGLPELIRLSHILPVRLLRKGRCQQVVHKDPDLDSLPVLKCWPHDGGRFVTLPMVHTIHPETEKTNVGMYRMQILDKKSTAMHWQRHKTGANHFEAWKRTGRRMPVSVALGGDPVYTYSATAPLPENIDEYLLAGFLRKKKVRLVKCLTNDLWVPEDADIIIEGYVDPAEELVWEGPFGDHTGFYSLADWYPRFHVTCITHSVNAVYPATIVGIPPQEDSFLTKATEHIFLAPIKLALQPEIEDIHMPDPGVAHNLVIVKIRKNYPGQGMKVMSSLFGAGQMMFAKYIVVISGNIRIRDYDDLLTHVFLNTDFERDLIFGHGPLDVLDHSSDKFSFGGKMGIDATEKTQEENSGQFKNKGLKSKELLNRLNDMIRDNLITGYNTDLLDKNIPLLILSVNRFEDSEIISKVIDFLKSESYGKQFKMIIAVDHTVDSSDYFTVAWQLLGNSDPARDHHFISASSIFIDGTIKAYQPGGFDRKWPNIICSDAGTIEAVDQKWESLGIGAFIPSPSLKTSKLKRTGNEEVMIK
jgi:4-hydroxy-3-polyprenylbenzoate decarboxylase